MDSESKDIIDRHELRTGDQMALQNGENNKKRKGRETECRKHPIKVQNGKG